MSMTVKKTALAVVAITAMILFLAPFGAQLHASTTISVPKDAQTIQQAIDTAVDGDIVIVDPGVYYENINFKGKKITVASKYLLTKDPTFIVNTVINGSKAKDPKNGSCVQFISKETRDSILEGFTITGGTGTVWRDEHDGYLLYTEGGGIIVALSSPTIRNNIIINNQAINAGTNISSAGGGGIRCGDGDPLIEHNVIAQNTGMYGAGIVMNYTPGGIIRNNIITGNKVYQAVDGKSTYGGGGIWLNGKTNKAVIENNTITGNESNGSGGGIMIYVDAGISIVGNIIWKNVQQYGGDIFGIGKKTIVEYNCITDGTKGTGNISTDPLLAPDTFIPAANSPCVDAGNPDPAYNDPENPAKKGSPLAPAQGTLRNDLGATGGPGAAPFAQFAQLK